MKKLVKRYLCALTSLAMLSGTAAVAVPVQAAQSKAVDALERRLSELDDTLYVYKDFANGFNNFTQKAWIGDNTFNIPKMNEAAAGYSGVSGIAAELDLTKHSWGGYMFLNGSLAADSTIPKNDFFGKGLDLTGAKTLSFYAKGKNGGERIEFFMNMDADKRSLGYVELSKDWKRFELDLKGAKLINVTCGFGWVTSDWQNLGKSKVEFFVDDIRYTFEKSKPRPMFIQSYESAKIGTDAAIINNFAYLYDNAAAAIALSRAGKHERARQIADAIVYASNHDRYYKDGRLRNAYSAGVPQSFPGWQSANGEFARLPGFYDLKDGQWYEDYYAVSTSTGNLAWAVMALCEVAENAPKSAEYLKTAEKIAGVILKLKSDTGGFTGGYEGWEREEVTVTYKSTEHNIDLAAAFDALFALTGDAKYKVAREHAKAFVLSMFDAEKGCFYTGTGGDGVIVNKEVLPLDTNTWAILALGKDVDGGAVMKFIEKNFNVGKGYDFNADKDGIWFEGTAQAALAYKAIGNDAKYKEILACLAANAKDGNITAADRDGVSTGFLVSGTDIPWEYGKRVHVGATAWLAFAELGTNPFEFKGGK